VHKRICSFRLEINVLAGLRLEPRLKVNINCFHVRNALHAHPQLTVAVLHPGRVVSLWYTHNRHLFNLYSNLTPDTTLEDYHAIEEPPPEGLNLCIKAGRIHLARTTDASHNSLRARRL